MTSYRLTLRPVLLSQLLSVTLGLASCAQACPAGLLEGTLGEHDGELVLIDDDVVQRVDWSASGYEVREVDDRLVVADWLGVKAGEGDFVSLGGGEHEAGLWRVCGGFGTAGTEG